MTDASIDFPKASDLARYSTQGLTIEPIYSTIQEAFNNRGLTLAERVIVGVDDIPTRWFVQRAATGWVGVGATSHWGAMASFHGNGGGCARCLHPHNDDDGALIAPTISFVSFWAGLWTAAYFIAQISGSVHGSGQVYISPTALGGKHSIWRSGVPYSQLCPEHKAVA